MIQGPFILRGSRLRRSHLRMTGRFWCGYLLIPHVIVTEAFASSVSGGVIAISRA
jgi:hypothetical protein